MSTKFSRNILGPVIILVLAQFTAAQVIGSIWPRVGSLAGGTKVTLWGSGFSTDAYNSVNFVYLGNIPCNVISYTATANQIECVTEPYPGGEEGHTYPYVQSTLITRGQYYVSTGGNDAFSYHWSYTPQVWNVDPRSGPIGAVVAIEGYRFTWDYNAYNQFYLGEQVCELRDENNVQYGIRSKWPILSVKCLSTEVKAGGWNASTSISGPSGQTWNHSRSLYPMFDWKLAMYELFPDIHSVYPQLGSTSGGALLTIQGTGFAGEDSDIEVDVDGIPCQVVSHTSTQIQCWTSGPPSDSPAIADDNRQYPGVDAGYRFKGGRGVRVNQYRNIGGSRISNLQSANKYPDRPNAVYTLPSFSTGSDIRRHGNYGERLMAFFNPHSTGRHSFFVSNDDGAEVWLAEGHNLTTTYQNSILDSPYATGFGNYERYEHQRSESMMLSSDGDYLLVGEFKEGGGAEYLTVGALLHDDTTFSYDQTKQVVREEQEILLTSAGLYDIQTLTVAVNKSAIDSDAPPSIVLEWGGRTAGPIPVTALELFPDLLGDVVLSLFAGECEFDRLHGINYYPGPIGYDFEGGVDSNEAWGPWNSPSPPQITEEEALCGRHSLFVEDHRALAFNVGNDNGQKTSDFPFICLGYKLPPGHSMAIAVNIQDYGWYSIPLSGEDTGPFQFTVVGHFFDELYNIDQLMDDDNWHYSCTDLHFMLIDNLPLAEDQERPRFHHILGMGLYTNSVPEQRGFYVDDVALASEAKSLFTDSYVAPARPNGRSLHAVHSVFSDNSNTDILNLTIALELVPSDCVDDLPMINTHLQNNNSVLQFSFERTQTASSPLGGTYFLSYDGQTSSPLNHDSTEEEIKTALEALDGIEEVTISRRTIPLSHDLLGRFCPGHSYRVLFASTRGDLPLIVVNDGGLSGDEATTTVTEVKAGGLFLRPIPGHMLQTVETTPQVHVRVRNQLAACSGGHSLYEEVETDQYEDYCSFVYTHSATPTVTMVTPTFASEGDTITITGTGFSEYLEENFVLFDSIVCTVTASTETSISCQLGEGFGGTKQLYLHVTSVGIAESSGFGLTYSVNANSVDISTGSQEGGTAIVISGSGFYTADFTVNAFELMEHMFANNLRSKITAGCQPANLVTIEDNPCEVISSTPDTITCLTPGETGTSSTYDIVVSVGCVEDVNTRASDTVQDAFTYDPALTPTVASISPSQGIVHGGVEVVISGSGFMNDVSAVNVMIGNEECAVTAATDTEVTCLAASHAEGVWSVIVVVGGIGRAAGDVTFTYSLQVTSISHCSGSLFGGQVLSIQGSGFGVDSEQVTVNLGTRSCDVTAVTDSEILCTTPPTTQIYEVNNNAYVNQ